MPKGEPIYGKPRVHFSHKENEIFCATKQQWKVPLEISKDWERVTCERCSKKKFILRRWQGKIEESGICD